jgi:hypothetical protein
MRTLASSRPRFPAGGAYRTGCKYYTLHTTIGNKYRSASHQVKFKIENEKGGSLEPFRG